MKEALRSNTTWGWVKQENKKNTNVLVGDGWGLAPLTETEYRTRLGKDNELNFTRYI